MWGYPLHVTWDLTAPKSLRCLRNEGRVCFFNLCTISSNQNKPPSLLGPFADPEVAPVSENNTDSTKRAKKDKHSFLFCRPLCMQEGLVLSQDGLAGTTTWTTLHHQPRAVGHLPLLHQLLHLLHLDNLKFEEDPKL
ncbi:uncharacterized protein LOC125154410 isoform X1 [Prionailurus viverrinus]|uniref:uncharacterized protein LOC125154410 isoform X1 n=1 Tax=Prionailurus viverrinus TaxID=61388 RepID=UPI001FF36B1F|nr:uncharacterized protein LOC125154410 isoform X1 [Prionailurus viverrinus]